MKKKKKKLLIIINPQAGKMKAKKALRSVINIFEKENYLVSVSTTRARLHATFIAKRKAKKYDLIVCLGGDGTLNEVFSGLVSLEKPPNLGYIPCGSTNDFASGLKLPKNILHSAKKIIKGKPLPIDVGNFNGRVFSYIASFGAFTQVMNFKIDVTKAEDGIDEALKLKVYDSTDKKVIYDDKLAQLDGKVYEDDYIFGAVTNAVSIGGVIKLDPKIAKLDDGLFELLLVKNPKNILEFNRIATRFLTRQFNDSLITFIQAKNIKIEAPEDMDWSLDGEYQKGCSDIQIINKSHAIKIIT